MNPVHFLGKIKGRDANKYEELKDLKFFDPHPLFELIDGETEDWEIIPPGSQAGVKQW